MAAAGFTPISLYYTTTSGAGGIPSAGNLVNGELAINITDGKLYYKDNGGTVQVIATKATGTIGGSTTQVQYNNAGVLAGSSNLTFDGTSLTLGGNPTLSAGTANGVLYLNGSKVATSGSALTFDGSTFAVTNASASLALSATKSADGNTAFFRRVGGTYNPGMYISLSDTVNNEIIFNTAYSSGNAPAYVWQQAGTEQMRLTSTGLGIGTSSPGAKLDVVGSIRAQGSAATTFNSFISVGTTTAANYGAITNTGNTLLWGVDSSAGGAVTGGAAYSAWIGSNAAYPFHLLTGGIVKATLDSSGNLGLGVTPSASTLLGIDISTSGGFVGTSSSAIVTNNTYWNGSNWVYKNTAIAGYYTVNGNAHQWYIAPSGTAGNAITFTQALTLDASGNLLLGGTSAGASSAASLAIFNGTAPTGSVTNGIILYAEDVSSSSELKVRDEAGNVTTLSPHNFSLIPEGPSEDMAWAYYSEKGGKRINVDMLKLARMVEKLTGEKLVYES